MEHVWMKEFNNLFGYYVPHMWYLQPVESRPTGGNKLHTFVDSAKVRFCCDVSFLRCKACLAVIDTHLPTHVRNAVTAGPR